MPRFHRVQNPKKEDENPRVRVLRFSRKELELGFGFGSDPNPVVLPRETALRHETGVRPGFLGQVTQDPRPKTQDPGFLTDTDRPR